MKRRKLLLLLLASLLTFPTLTSCGSLFLNDVPLVTESIGVKDIYNTAKNNGYNGSYEDWIKDIAEGKITSDKVYVGTFMVLDKVYQYQAVLKYQPLTIPEPPTLNDYFFLDWYYETEDNTWNFSENLLRSNVVLHAKLLEKVERTIKLDVGGIADLEEKEVKRYYKLYYELPVPTTADDLEFIGWYFNDERMTDSYGKSFEPLTIEKDVTFVAKYRKLPLVPWTLKEALSDGNLNYCFLLGGYNDPVAIERTFGVRYHLGTVGDEDRYHSMGTAPHEGNIVVNNKEYKVNELYQASPFSYETNEFLDRKEAKKHTEKWLLESVEDIDFFVANTDSLAEASLEAYNWREDMPIFGYGATATTLELMKQNKIMGTINDNVSGQVAGLLMAMRNATENMSEKQVFTSGFTEPNKYGYGQLSSKFKFDNNNRTLFPEPIIINKYNLDKFYKKNPLDLIDTGVNNGFTAIKDLFVSYGNNKDNTLSNEIKPLLEAYAPKFKFNLTEVTGDGNDESSVIDKLKSSTKHDAYAINLIKNMAAQDYLDTIATTLGASESKPTDVPVIFYQNRPCKADGSYNGDVLKDKRFKHVYFVGPDIENGAVLNGRMIADYFEDKARE